jgi:hypothetical protein
MTPLPTTTNAFYVSTRPSKEIILKGTVSITLITCEVPYHILCVSNFTITGDLYTCPNAFHGRNTL